MTADTGERSGGAGSTRAAGSEADAMPRTGPLAEMAARLRAVHPSLSPQLRQAARYVLAHPEDVALTSMRRLARHADVKPSTMVRLARALGFEGYESFREPYRDWLRGGDGPFLARARSLQSRSRTTEDARARLLDDMVGADAEALGAIATGPNAAALEGACTAIRAARTVHVMGMRACYSLAHLFHYAYSIVDGNAVLVDGPAGTLYDRLARIEAPDVLFAMGFRPYSADTVRAVDLALDRGADVIALTDSMVSPLAHGARQVILIDTASPSYFQSLVPALAQIQALLALLVAAGGEDTLEAITRTERDMTAFGAYWQEPKRRRRASS